MNPQIYPHSPTKVSASYLLIIVTPHDCIIISFIMPIIDWMLYNIPINIIDALVPVNAPKATHTPYIWSHKTHHICTHTQDHTSIQRSSHKLLFIALEMEDRLHMEPGAKEMKKKEEYWIGHDTYTPLKRGKMNITLNCCIEGSIKNEEPYQWQSFQSDKPKKRVSF